jgi:hypothetical protein
MKSRKAPTKVTPTTTDLRAKDPRVLRAEIDHFRQKIAEKAARDPRKAAVLVTEWVNKPATGRKKAA